jgi:hypothetical protein
MPAEAGLIGTAIRAQITDACRSESRSKSLFACFGSRGGGERWVLRVSGYHKRSSTWSVIQDILAGPDWDGVLTAEDERGLTPLSWSRVLSYGEIKLNMNTRLALGG